MDFFSYSKKLRCRLLSDIEGQLGLTCGTSSCLMALSREAHFVPGVWGPFCSALLPGRWYLGGGQSLVGGLIDHVIRSHPASEEASNEAEKRDMTIHGFLEQRLEIIKEAKVRNICIAFEFSNI